jgi:molybdenum-dependent DNA-binding transcriptional regulator ModE
MKVLCSHCGQWVDVNGIGRKRLDMPVKNIYDRIRATQSVVQAAKELGVSKSYIFKVLKANGLTLKEVRG